MENGFLYYVKDIFFHSKFISSIIHKFLSTIFVPVEIEEKPKKSVWRFPKENSVLYKIWWIYTWPLKFVLGLTVPSPVTCRRFYPLSFVMCIVWIGVNSYFVSWSMTVLGKNNIIIFHLHTIPGGKRGGGACQGKEHQMFECLLFVNACIEWRDLTSRL